ncbi:DUF6318 family protein [Nesterenkonia sp. PF2B19]|uniref:DUF6318 family protein n=1 Tax=Nesterenkonia sp. PF2B19 TaxID=1881858 RepID=UPI000871E5D8|nr:DUF6318 family protein [Nesterenkonia sp. PF2B19]OSM43070.1 hypothetical protein BCY76_010560 [Nesterenkonia sp. PF2B19]
MPASSAGPAENWPEPEVPDEVYEETEEGALAALESWFEARHYLQLTGDDGPLWDLSSQDCEHCTNVADRLTEAYESGDRWYDAESTTIDSPYAREAADGVYTILLDVHEGEFTFYEVGQVLGEGGGKHYDVSEAILVYEDGSWLVRELAVEQAE